MNEDLNISSPNSSSGEYFNKYSTNEQIVGEWIDGKPIYRRVLNDSSFKLGAKNSYTYLFNLSNYNIDLLINRSGMVHITNGTILYLDHASLVSGCKDGKFYVYHNDDSHVNATIENLIIEYTKITG